MHIPKWLVATAGFLFMTLIAAVAFFIGRESSQPPAAVTAVSAPVQELPSTSDAPSSPEPGSAVVDAAGGTTPPIAASPSVTADTGARDRVSAYFRQMDALDSGVPIGDQQAFATTVLQGALSGDFSAIDDVVRAAADAERRAAAVLPPAECAEYHRMAVTLLQESRTMITALRDGLKRNDTNALTAVGDTAQSMKSRADTLAAAEKALRERFGL